jgi:hypothetical protein
MKRVQIRTAARTARPCCSQDALRKTGGDGLLFCFVAN